MIELLITIGILAPSIMGVLLHMRSTSQKRFDADRTTYELVFPKRLTDKQVEAALRSMGANLRDHTLTGDPSIVFEVQSSSRGIQHFIRVPSRDAEYLVDQLEGHIPGIDVTEAAQPADIRYRSGVTLRMTSPERTLPISSAAAYAVKTLKALSTTDDEVITLQWIVYHTSRLKTIESGPPTRSASPSLMRLLFFGESGPSREETADRQEKVSEQNYAAVGRIAAQADTHERSRDLVGKVVRALTSETRSTNMLKTKPIPFDKLTSSMNGATSPFNRDLRFTIPELTAFIGWPIDDPQIVGLTQGSAKRIPPSASVATEGRVLGRSNHPHFKDRPIALGYEYADRNAVFLGMIGSGKSVGMANFIYDDMQNGYGVVVIDAASSRSDQSLSSRAIQYVPEHRVSDVVYIDVVAGAQRPIAFNSLDQGDGLGAIDRHVGVFTSRYPDIERGVSVRDLLYHGLWTLIEHGGYTLLDLGALIRPLNPAELRWADSVIKGVKDPALHEFWGRMKKEGHGSPAKVKEWDKYVDPLFRRLWQLTGRPEIRDMIGQTQNALKWDDILSQNKIAIISLAGLPKESAELLGSLLVDSLWTSAQRLTPSRGNGLYLDEFQVASHIRNGVGDLLNRGRKHKLWTTLGTQFVSELPSDTRNSIFTNVGTRVVYKVGAGEAYTWRKEFGTDLVTEADFQHGREYEAVAQVLNQSGRSTVTVASRAPEEPTGFGDQAIALSSERFGTPVEEVHRQIIARRTLSSQPSSPPRRPPTIGDVDGEDQDPYGRSPQ